MIKTGILHPVKPFSSQWYVRVSFMARIRIRATTAVCKSVGLDEDIEIWNEYVRMLQRASRVYGYVMLRGYRAFHREMHSYKNGK